MFGELVDNLVSIFSPESGVRRKVARQAISNLRSYDAGKLDRTVSKWRTNAESGDSPNIGEVQRTRNRSWDLYRNNCYARKAVNALAAHVVGIGFKVESLAAVGRNGGAYSKFRSDAAELWEQFQASAFGLPGRGGMTFAEGTALAFREWLLSGECFVHLKSLPNAQWRTSQYPLPLQLELLESERLIEDTFGAAGAKPAEGNVINRGIEFDSQRNRVAYHFYKQHPNEPSSFRSSLDTVRIPAAEILHIYSPARPSQKRGVSQFAPAVLRLKNIDDYEYNEQIASAVSSCVSLIVRTQTGGGRLLGSPAGASGTDQDGNKIDRLQPGAILRLAQGEEAEGFNPARPNAGVDGFVQHMLRGVSDSLPGLKSSTLTGDYRNSSFSSERSADNDCWRELEQVQEFFMSHLCQPVWERFIEVAIESSKLSAPGFAQDKFRHYRATWNGPVAKSINPVNDENASKIAIETGTASLQTECAARGLNWREVLQQQAEEKALREKLGLTQSTEGQIGGTDAAAPKPKQSSTKSALTVFGAMEREAFEPQEEREAFEPEDEREAFDPNETIEYGFVRN